MLLFSYELTHNSCGSRQKNVQILRNFSQKRLFDAFPPYGNTIFYVIVKIYSYKRFIQ